MKSIKSATYVLLLFTSACFASSAIDKKPGTPYQLSELLAAADRIVVTKNSLPEGPKTLFESRKREDIDALSKAALVKIPDIGFVCLCIGSPAIDIYKGEELLARITNHHGSSISCSLWNSHAYVADQESWLGWFDKRGISQPREQVEQRKLIRKKNNKPALQSR